jgi:glycerol-3-phosphate dehydrogenase (NAD(P)+)
MSRIAILGGGSWGTALAVVLSRSRVAHEISLWVHDPNLAAATAASRENATYLPGLLLPASIEISSDLEATLDRAEIIVGAMPSSHARELYTAACASLDDGTAIVSATKGLEPLSHARMSEVISQVSRPQSHARLAVLSGPSFAVEAARGEPTALVIASHNLALATQLQQQLSGPAFRLYTNQDVLGIELAAAMKNVIAIAAGACQGLGLGSNALAALITRGLAEMTRLALALGAKRETLSGLAGLGDLVLTCTGGLSRNRYVGIELAKGRSIKDIRAGMKMVAEGVGTASALLVLARENAIEMPITEQVNAILHQEKPPAEAIRDIMDRAQ